MENFFASSFTGCYSQEFCIVQGAIKGSLYSFNITYCILYGTKCRKLHDYVANIKYSSKDNKTEHNNRVELYPKMNAETKCIYPQNTKLKYKTRQNPYFLIFRNAIRSKKRWAKPTPGSVQAQHNNRLCPISIPSPFLSGSLRGAVGRQLALRLLNMGDQVLNSTDLDPPLPRKLDAVLTRHHAGPATNRLPGHLLAVVDNLANGRDGLLAREAAKLGSSLGMALASAGAAGDGAQRQDMPGAAQVGGRGLGVGEDAAGEGAVVGADARGGERVLGVDGDGVGGAARVLGVGDHGREVEGVGSGARHGHADVARGVADHPAHLLGGDVLGGDDEVAFVFAAGVVEDEEELAIACGG